MNRSALLVSRSAMLAAALVEAVVDAFGEMLLAAWIATMMFADTLVRPPLPVVAASAFPFVVESR